MNDKKNILDLFILNWNGELDTIDCLKSINTSVKNDVNMRLFVIDNGSDFNKFEIMHNWCVNNYNKVVIVERKSILNKSIDLDDFDLFSDECIYLIKNNENLGFASGNNVGLSLSKLLNTKYVCLLNNDTVIKDDAIQSLYKTLHNEKCVSVIPQIRLFFPDNKIWNCGGKISWHGNRKYYFQGSLIEDINVYKNKVNSNILSVEYSTGCCLMYRLDLMGLLTDKFFFGEEDFEFSLRSGCMSYRMLCDLNSIIYHKVGGTQNVNGAQKLGAIYIHQLQRLINTSNFYTKKKHLLLRFLININSIYSLVFIKRFKVLPVIRMLRLLNVEWRCKESVDKNYFSKYRNETFER